MLRQLLEAIRNRGYAWRNGGMLEGFNYQTSTIAIPICTGDDVRAAIAITFFRPPCRSMKPRENISPICSMPDASSNSG